MKAEARTLLAAWLRSLEAKRLTANTISAYEQSFLHFYAFLESHGLALAEVRASTVSDFALDRFVLGNSRKTAIHYVDCVRQFFIFHRRLLKVPPTLFNLRRVRVAYDCFERSGISRKAGREASKRHFGRILTVSELRATHAAFHPRG